MSDSEKRQIELLEQILQALKTLNGKSEVIAQTLKAIQEQGPRR